MIDRVIHTAASQAAAEGISGRYHLTIGGLDRTNDLYEALNVDSNGNLVSNPALQPQSEDIDAEVVADTDPHNFDIDLSDKSLNGFLQIVLEISAEGGTGLDAVTLTLSPLFKNAAGTLVVPDNSTPISLKSAYDFSGVGSLIAFDIGRAIADDGDKENMLSYDGMRVILTDSDASGTDTGTIVGRWEYR